MADHRIVDFEHYLDAVAPAVGLRIADEYRAEALTYLRLAAAIAQSLIEFDLDQSVEPADTFALSESQRRADWP